MPARSMMMRGLLARQRFSHEPTVAIKGEIKRSGGNRIRRAPRPLCRQADCSHCRRVTAEKVRAPNNEAKPIEAPSPRLEPCAAVLLPAPALSLELTPPPPGTRWCLSLLCHDASASRLRSGLFLSAGPLPFARAARHGSGSACTPARPPAPPRGCVRLCMRDEPRDSHAPASWLFKLSFPSSRPESGAPLRSRRATEGKNLTGQAASREGLARLGSSHEPNMRASRFGCGVCTSR